MSLLLEYYLSDAGSSLIKGVGLSATVIVAELGHYTFNLLRRRAAATLVNAYQRDPPAQRSVFHRHLNRLAQREPDFLPTCQQYLTTYQQSVKIN